MSLQQLVECELDGRVGHQQEGGLGPIPQSSDTLLISSEVKSSLSPHCPHLHRYLDEPVQYPSVLAYIFLYSAHLESGVDNPQGVRQ